MLNKEMQFTTFKKETKIIKPTLLYGLTKYVKLNDQLWDTGK
jgi:hypothetical protein